MSMNQGELAPQVLEEIKRVEWSNQPVLTTAQLAEFYEYNELNIRDNFINNTERFIEGKYFFKIEGDALNILRNENFGLQISPKTRVVYL